MKTISVQGDVAADGTLRLVLPTGLAPGPVDVVVVVQPTSLRDTSVQSLSGKYAGRLRNNVDVLDESRKIRAQATREAEEIPE